MLHFGIDYPVFLKKPHTFSSNLECLDLKNVLISKGFLKWLSSSCKCIKELSLDNCWIGTITIQSSSLELFQYTDDESDFSDLNIIAPNLKFLAWKANMRVPHNLEQCTRLERVELLLKPEVDDTQFLVDVLRSICRVKYLTLNHQIFMVLFEGGSMPAFENVSHLCLGINRLHDTLIPAVVSLLRGMPNLSTLEMISAYSTSKGCSGFDTGYWVSQNLDFIHKLEEIDIHMLSGSNTIGFARYILEHAQNLKKMRIAHLPNQSKFRRKINKSKRMSNARVVFEECEES